MLVHVAHDEFHDPGNVPPRCPLGEADPVELLVRKRADQSAEMLRGDLEEGQRVVSRWQAQPGASASIELVRDFPVERERLLADEDLLDPATWAHDALPDVVRDVADRPALTAAWQSPLLVSEGPQQLLECRKPL